MSLTSDWELAQTPAFRGKVTQAIAKALLRLAAEGSDTEKAYAKRSLSNLHYVAEQLGPVVATYENVDTSASDKTIEAAALEIVKAAI